MTALDSPANPSGSRRPAGSIAPKARSSTRGVARRQLRTHRLPGPVSQRQLLALARAQSGWQRHRRTEWDDRLCPSLQRGQRDEVRTYVLTSDWWRQQRFGGSLFMKSARGHGEMIERGQVNKSAQRNDERRNRGRINENIILIPDNALDPAPSDECSVKFARRGNPLGRNRGQSCSEQNAIGAFANHTRKNLAEFAAIEARKAQ